MIQGGDVGESDNKAELINLRQHLHTTALYLLD